MIAGPFKPLVGQPVVVTLSGSWSGSAQMLRSVDGGATRLPLTLGGGSWGSYSGNVKEPAWTESEQAATLWLDLQPAFGTIAYRRSAKRAQAVW